MNSDNGGWGLKTMLIFCGIFVLACFISYSIYRETFGSVGIMGNFHEAQAEKSVIERSNSTSQNESFGSYEKEMIKASKKYIYDKKIEVNEDETLVVNLKDLIKENYIKSMSVNNKKCKGYLRVTDDITKPYLSCDGYSSFGYMDTYASEESE